MGWMRVFDLETVEGLKIHLKMMILGNPHMPLVNRYDLSYMKCLGVINHIPLINGNVACYRIWTKLYHTIITMIFKYIYIYTYVYIYIHRGHNPIAK